METRLFVRNLASSVELYRLESLFDAVGEVESSEYGPPDVRNGLNTAYVNMRTPQGASDGIERLNGHRCEGLSLVVTRDEPHQPLRKPKSKKRGQK